MPLWPAFVALTGVIVGSLVTLPIVLPVVNRWQRRKLREMYQELDGRDDATR